MIEPGTTLQGRYRIDRAIGEGGMAVVFLGRDLLLDRDVAVKALRPQFAADPQFRVRFRREAQAAAGFSHPNIVDVYDVGETAGQPWFVMAYVPGQTLKAVIATEAPFHPDDVAGLLQQVCSALDYAHERGYVHRDVKPQNILVDPDGHAVVADFGIAKGMADADLTQTAAGFGTVHYVSPEQAAGSAATPASDVYAVGVVAFEMLTGRLPFEAGTPVAVAMRHLHEPPPAPSDLLPSIPPAVDAIVLRALDKDPTRRFPSAGALARAMTYWRQYRPPSLGGDPGATAPLGVGAGRTLVGPAPAPLAAPAGSGGPPPPRAGRAGGPGWLTWLVGGTILVGLVALIVFGGRLAEGLRGEPDPERSPVSDVRTPTPAPAVVAEPTREATAAAPPTIAPAEPTAPVLASVPDLVGRTLGEAEALLAEQGLGMAVGPPLPSDNVAPGAVVVQDRAPGDAAPLGSVVTVRPSGGVDEPDLVDIAAMDLPGKPAGVAEALLRQAGLVPVSVEESSDDVLPGFVVGVDPADRAPAGSRVTVRVSDGRTSRPGGERGFAVLPGSAERIAAARRRRRAAACPAAKGGGA
jgi:eukaryotic-like serine/threonine-protein kinase